MSRILPPDASFDFPPLALIGQKLHDETIADPRAALRQALTPLKLQDSIRPGQRVALTAGSRGIAGLAEVLAELVAVLRELGAEPFIVPSMGSHGGATAEGQRKVLESLGLGEDKLGAPILSDMNTVLLGESPAGAPAHLDAHAAKADHIIVVNRVKSHTKFKGRIESGLMKMLAIGLGKHQGAALLHGLAPALGMETVILEAARITLAKAPVLLGVGLVENAFGRLCELRAFPAAELEAGEIELLRRAKEVSPKIPFAELDLLVVDEIGKDISGTGMDTNVTGRNRDILGDFTGQKGFAPHVKRILVRGLTNKTEGNAMGLGFADVTTQRCVDAVDRQKTGANALTGVSPEKAAIPLTLPNDREALAAALHTLGRWDPNSVRVAHIRNTLRLDRLLVSPALLPLLPDRAEILREPEPIFFDDQGDMLGEW